MPQHPAASHSDNIVCCLTLPALAQNILQEVDVLWEDHIKGHTPCSRVGPFDPNFLLATRNHANMHSTMHNSPDQHAPHAICLPPSVRDINDMLAKPTVKTGGVHSRPTYIVAIQQCWPFSNLVVCAPIWQYACTLLDWNVSMLYCWVNCVIQAFLQDAQHTLPACHTAVNMVMLVCWHLTCPGRSGAADASRGAESRSCCRAPARKLLAGLPPPLGVLAASAWRSIPE